MSLDPGTKLGRYEIRSQLGAGGMGEVTPNGRGGTWNSGGVIVFAPSTEGPLYRISAAGGEVTPVTQLDESSNEISHR